VAQCDEPVVAGSSIHDEAAVRTILVVEDNELNMKLFHDLLCAHGYKVLKAGDGVAGLQLAREHHPDLIVMDIQLPGEISGLDVTRSLKEDDDLKSIPIVAVTAFAMKGDDKRIRDAGCDGYIPKPISATGFLKSIKEYLC
jgi:two-component system cell cycle response regulator DivK